MRLGRSAAALGAAAALVVAGSAVYRADEALTAITELRTLAAEHSC